MQDKFLRWDRAVFGRFSLEELFNIQKVNTDSKSCGWFEIQVAFRYLEQPKYQRLLPFDNIFQKAKWKRNDKQNDSGNWGELEHRVRNAAQGDKK